MPVKFKDYYETLGVSRSATAEEIRRAYRQLARKHHPDANKGDSASEDKFKEINEAYEVLKDPEKRRRYDMLGENWKAGQDFRPPPGFEGFAGGFPGGGPGGARGFNFGGFSDFFEALFGGGFGQHGGAGGRGPRVEFRTGPGGFGGSPFTAQAGPSPFDEPQAPPPSEATIEVPISRIVHGGLQKISLSIPGKGTRRFDVRIPSGIEEGKKIRLRGEGPGGTDIHLRVRYASDALYRIEGGDLIVNALVPPPVAALGGKVSIETPDGPVSLTIPAGSNSGRRLRLRDRGLPRPNGTRGDLYAQIMIGFPAPLTPEQHELYERLRTLEG